MKLIKEAIKFLINIIFKHKSFGNSIKVFCENMGVAYIKLAQILATQNYRGILNEKDRKDLMSICDEVAPIPYKEIEEILKTEYGDKLYDIFTYIDPESVGSASVSQVHRAVLKNGKEVAIKIKRKDVVLTINKDIKTIRFFYNHFGWMLQLTNKIGGNHALDLYLKWILEETDFVNEKNNIKKYQDFANTMNSKFNDSYKIVIPSCYEELCTENVIVMDFVSNPTIKKMKLNEENKKRLSQAIKSYLMMSFYAVLHDEKVIFHGDPHGGNIYIDDNNNIGFLDMGLVFQLSDEDKKLLKEFALAAFSKDYERIYDCIISFGDLSDKKAQKLKTEIKDFCEKIGSKDITYYFSDMIEICIRYEILPPNFLFCMSKAFLCMNGINDQFNIVNTATDIMIEQMTEYILTKSLTDCKRIIKSGKRILPKITRDILEVGILGAVSKESRELLDMYAEYEELVGDYKEFIQMIKANYENISNDQGTKSYQRKEV